MNSQSDQNEVQEILNTFCNLNRFAIHMAGLSKNPDETLEKGIIVSKKDPWILKAIKMKFKKLWIPFAT